MGTRKKRHSGRKNGDREARTGGEGKWKETAPRIRVGVWLGVWLGVWVVQGSHLPDRLSSKGKTKDEREVVAE